MLIKKTVENFSMELASDSPAPGGGSVSALAGSLAAALVAMVSNLTVGKEKFCQYEPEVQKALEDAEGLREKLLELVDEDTEAFNKVMVAFKLPKETEMERQKRSSAIQQAFIGAAQLPLQVVNNCLRIMQTSEVIIDWGNPNAVSDAGVSVLMAAAGARGAAMNVRINLGSIKDEERKKKLNTELQEMMDRLRHLEKRLLNKVNEKIG